MHSHVTNDGDCDDNDASVHPGATESCDGVDENCNGTVDEGLETTTYYADSDSDGYGDDSDSVESCAPVDGRTEDATDCDDTSASAYPGGEEISWNDVDEDCDGYDIDFAECVDDTIEDSIDYLTGWAYTVSDMEGTVTDPFLGIFTIGSYAITDGFLWLEEESFEVTPSAEYDVFNISITMNLYMTSHMEAVYEGFEPSSCELESGPVSVNYNGTMEVNPHADYASSTVYLSTMLLDDPSTVTYFEGCSMDLFDVLFDAADIDFSVTSMVDERMLEVANAFEGLLEEDLEIQTELTCRP
jgi:hypothetical protein